MAEFVEASARGEQAYFPLELFDVWELFKRLTYLPQAAALSVGDIRDYCAVIGAEPTADEFNALLRLNVVYWAAIAENAAKPKPTAEAKPDDIEGMKSIFRSSAKRKGI